MMSFHNDTFRQEESSDEEQKPSKDDKNPTVQVSQCNQPDQVEFLRMQ